MTDEADLVLCEIDGPIALVTLNRPQAMNALSSALQKAFAKTVDALAANPTIRVMILTGAGNRAFTAGLDLKELGSGGDIGALASSDADIMAAMERFPGPIIGAINGVAITGGFELALACDVLIGTPHTRFADTHARVGIVPGWGLSQRLSRIIGPSRAKELAFTGNFLDAETACAWGIINRIVPAEDLLPTAWALARDMCECVPEMIPVYKQLINNGYAANFGDGIALEQKMSRAHNGAVKSDDVAERREAIQSRGRAQG